ncbi:MAG: 3-oxoacyl-ACP reductase FabG [Candidatus Excrementavichristensenella sp.]|jgi:3-oxoacyl-[acyl-carrier protein] reductase
MLKGKLALITGASRGIGAAIAHRLAAMGMDIAAVARNIEPARALCRELQEQYSVRAVAYSCDVASFQGTKELVRTVQRELGTPWILVNNAGITRDGLVAMMGEEAFDAVLDTNLKGAFNMIRHCAPGFLRAKGGCILNIGSVSGLMGNPGQCNYAASKAGLVGLTKSVARELAPRGVRCNLVAPGYIQSDMTKEIPEAVLGNIPLGRMGSPQDVAEAAAYLATATYVTGAVLTVDGGISM